MVPTRLVAALRPRRRHFPFRAPGPEGLRSDRSTRWALGVIVGVVLAQLVFLTVGCDWDLCGDETECWTWSRRLDWSYYARGPLIALIIRCGVELAGGLSLALTGSLMPAVRLPAVLLAGLTAWGVFRLTVETTRSRRAGLLAVALLPAVPLFRVGGLLMTVDTPLVCCWTWAAVWAYRGTTRDDTRAWLAAGVLAALGVLAKYTMLAFPASIGLYLLLDGARRRQLLRPGFWMSAGLCGSGMVPIVSWNAWHDWVGAGQMADRFGLTTPGNWGRWETLPLFLGGEVAVLGLAGIVGTWAVGRATVCVVRRRDEAETRSGLLFLLCAWVVVWTACAAACLLGESEANWSAPAHVAVIALCGWQLDLSLFPIGKHLARRLTIIAWGLSLLGLTALQHTEWFYPALARFVPAPSAANPAPISNLDPTCRMRGVRELAPVVQARLNFLRAEGLDPFVLAPTYMMASALEFSLPDHPEIYCLSWTPDVATRAANQHDVWRPNPRLDLSVFGNRPAIVVENACVPPSYAKATLKQGMFRSAEPTARVNVDRAGLIVAAWDVTVCHDYQGLRWIQEIEGLLKNYSAPGYYAAQGGTADDLMDGLYRDVLGRALSPPERDYWRNQLACKPRRDVVRKLLVCDEARAKQRR